MSDRNRSLNSAIDVFEKKGDTESVALLKEKKEDLRKEWLSYNFEMNEERLFLTKQCDAIVNMLNRQDLNELIAFANEHNI